MKTLLARVLVYPYAMTWNATGYSSQPHPVRDDHARHGMEAEGSTMATEDPTNLLYSFRGAYGRLCHLTCKALHNKAPEFLVLEAFEGGGSYGVPVLNAIRTAYVESNEALRRATPQYTMDELTKVAYEVRRAHEGEWLLEIPAAVA